ncbi:MAG: UDP-N-acetylmuramate dehydrogenase [Clostridiales bacterium]|nr:UDP-N-acetylmuramate dehydrogenase [Clostridiales bacterium]
MEWHKLENWIAEKQIGEWLAQAPLSAYTSWKIGGPARLMVWPEGEGKLAQLIKHCSREGFPLRFLGLGTNLLASDEGVEALVVHTGKLDQAVWPAAPQGDVESAVTVEAGAGLPLAGLAAAAARKGLRGLEFAAGIPGSFGGALIMNAGAYGGQISDLVEYVRCMDAEGDIHVLDGQEAGFGYRSSSLRESGELIVSGALRLIPGDADEIRALMDSYLQARREKQPLDLPSGGSVFRNPAGGGAGRYIDQAGLKGQRVGGAQISGKHANFIVNLGGAKAGEVRELMEAAGREVRERFGVELESEIVYWE